MYPNILYLDPIGNIFRWTFVLDCFFLFTRDAQIGSNFQKLPINVTTSDPDIKSCWMRICWAKSVEDLSIIDNHCQLTSINIFHLMFIAFFSCSPHGHLIFSPLCLSQLQDCKRFIRFAPLGCGTDMIEELQDGPLPLISRRPQLHSRGDIPFIKPIIGV